MLLNFINRKHIMTCIINYSKFTLLVNEKAHIVLDTHLCKPMLSPPPPISKHFPALRPTCPVTWFGTFDFCVAWPSDLDVWCMHDYTFITWLMFYRVWMVRFWWQLGLILVGCRSTLSALVWSSREEGKYTLEHIIMHYFFCMQSLAMAQF